MKVQFIITDYGSFNNFLGDVAIALCNRGDDVHVVCSEAKVITVSDRYNYVEEGVKFTFIPFPRGFNFFKHRKASKAIHQATKEFNPDLVSIHFTTGMFTTTLVGRLPFYTLGTFHGLGYPVMDTFIKRAMFRFIEGRCVKRIDEAWVLNKMDFDVLVKEFPERNIILQPTKGLGCNLEKFDPSRYTATDKLELRDELSIDKDDFILCFTGRFVFFKGYNKVIRAMRILLEEKGMKGLKLLLLGGNDPAHPTGLTQEEEGWVRANSDIIDIGFTDEVSKYLSITNLFVFPSEKEGMPVCIIEALAMAVPVVTTNSRGCADLVTDGHNGVVLMEDASPEELAENIFTLMQDCIKYTSLKECTLEDRESLDRKKFINQQVDLFRSLNKEKMTTHIQ